MTFNYNDKPKIIMICGPTAIGKTSITVRISELLAGEVVSADSMQIYRHMDVGTAKPSAEEKCRAFHHMIDIVNPDESYDAARFSREARASIYSILKQGRLPIIAGGTGFYIKALLYGLCDAAPEDDAVRQRLAAEAEQEGNANIYKRLEVCDPAAAKIIHPNDTYRVIRALEVYETSGMSMTEFRRRHRFADSPYNVLKIGLFMDRQVLYDRIDRRVDFMVGQGLCGEVKRLLEMGYHEDLRPMQALGYRHMSAYLRGAVDWEETVAMLKRDTRNYAKRQLTWFRKDLEIKWFEPESIDRIIACARDFVDKPSTNENQGFL